MKLEYRKREGLRGGHNMDDPDSHAIPKDPEARRWCHECREWCYPGSDIDFYCIRCAEDAKLVSTAYGVRFGYWPCIPAPYFQASFGRHRYSWWVTK